MISIFDLFTVGIGPSSSHTIGPMRAANSFVNELADDKLLAHTKSITVQLFGSLAFTGEGHGTDRAITVGLEGHTPETVDPDFLHLRFATIKKNKHIKLDEKFTIEFDPDAIIHDYDTHLPGHPNALCFTAHDEHQKNLHQKTYYSIGGGTIVENVEESFCTEEGHKVPYPFASAKELLQLCYANKLRIAELMMENEKIWKSEYDIKTQLLELAEIMQETIDRGCTTPGILPGGLNVKRRAPILYEQTIKSAQDQQMSCDKDSCIIPCSGSKEAYLISAGALAVGEENAAGNRIVVAPTCGAAGVLPAVLWYSKKFCANIDDAKIIEFLLTAAAIEILYKKQASISGAEVGCQGEVGVACSMAAAGLTAMLGGNLQQVENAAEIGIEHHLGLTCDPIKGLVQIPCIERNAVAANQAVNIAHLVLSESGEHAIFLDNAIQTMKQTGLDMSKKYKETALGGLAVNIPNC
ncbi:MAG: L-serine ammonia-lyase [Gammaproteobacteria bacterium]|jgi:L-serine dehydratase